MSSEEINQPQSNQGEVAQGGKPSAPGGPRLGRSVLLAVLIVVVAVLVVAVVVGAPRQVWEMYRARDEPDARKALKDLGALVVLDSSRKYAFSLNLGMPKVRDNLDAAIGHLPDLVYLENLALSKTTITDEQLANVAGLSYLASLRLGNTAVTDAGLFHITGLGNLRALYLGNTNITAKGLPMIGQIGSLAILDLSKTKVDGDFAALEKLDELKWLVIQDMEISDAAIDTLGRLPGLGRLSINRSQVSEEALARLKEAKPNIVIDQ